MEGGGAQRREEEQKQERRDGETRAKTNLGFTQREAAFPRTTNSCFQPWLQGDNKGGAGEFLRALCHRLRCFLLLEAPGRMKHRGAWSQE